MKKLLALVLALVMTLSLCVTSNAAYAGEEFDYDEAVEVMSAIGVFQGDQNGKFNPKGILTREQAAKIVTYMLLGKKSADALVTIAAPFADVAADRWSAGSIAYCYNEGILAGVGEGKFAPTAELTGLAFAKMMLTALGYDAEVEGLVGANWSINAAKLALTVGLTKGLDNVALSQPMTREQAAKMAFNTMKATMVEYENESTIIIDGVGSVTTSSAAKDVANTAVTETIKNDNKMQFAEKYFTNLKMTAGDNDAFDRPATTWKVKTSTVGTYVDAADLTYTTEVKLGTIYSDLGLTKSVAANKVTFHVNGATEAASGNDNSSTPVALDTLGLSKGLANKIGGNGVLTEVFYDEDAESVIITLVSTYAGEVTGVHAATSSYDAYINVAPAVSGVGTSGTFETNESYAVDDVVLYTYSVKSGEGIQSVVPAEIVTGSVSAYTEQKNITVGDALYSAAKVYASSLTGMNGTIGYDVDLVLDEYGYVLKVDTTKASDNYAVILAHDNNAVDGGRAKLLFTDGSTQVVNLKNTTIADYSDSYTSATPVLSDNDIVRYVVDGNGKYTLTLLGDAGAAVADKTLVTKGTAAPGTGANTYANTGAALSSRDLINSFNGKTIFLIKSLSGTSTVYNSYTGIANVPTVSIGSTASVQAIYAKTVSGAGAHKTGVATVVYIDATKAGSTVNSSSKDVVFVKGSSVGQSYTASTGYYYTYDAIVNGVITKINTVTQTTTDTLYSTVNYDKNNIATLGNPVKSGTASYGDTVNGALYGTKTDVEANGTIGLLGTYYSYADDVEVFYKDTDGNMSAYSIKSIAKDDNDKVFVKFVDGEVSTIVIVQVAEGGASGSESTYSVGTAFTAAASTTGITLATGTIVDQDNAGATIASGLTVTAVAKAWTGSAWTTYATATDTAASISSGTLSTTLTTGLTNGVTYQITVTLSGNEFGTLELFNNTVTVA